MKIKPAQLRFQVSNEKGVALTVALVMLFILSAIGIFGVNTSIIEIWRSSNYRSTKLAYYAADAGIEDGISRLVRGVVSDSGSETSTTWNNAVTYNSSPNFSNSFTIQHRLAGSPAAVATDTNGKPQYLIRSTGTSGNAQKTIETAINLLLSSPFSAAMVGCNEVKITGSGMVDSYNSQNGTYASQATNTDAQGNTYANNNGGLATTNPGGEIKLTGSTAIHGDVNSTGTITNTGTATVYGNSSQNVSTSTCDPIGVPALVNSKDPGGTLSDIKTTQTVSASSSPINCNDFKLTGSESFTITGSGNVIMYVDGDLDMSGSSQFIISSGVNLTLYIKGEISITGQGFVNNNATPSSLIIYASHNSTTSSNDIKFTGSSTFYGAVYAPLANINFSGNNASYGAVRGKTVTATGSSGFHYDEALGSLSGGSPIGYQLIYKRDIYN